VSFQEKYPEIGQREEFLLVCENVKIEDLREQEFSFRVVVLELHFKNCSVVLI
jgi:hypothetical protein